MVSRKALLPDGTAVVLRRPKDAELRAIGKVFAEAVREGVYFGTDHYRFDMADERAWVRARAGRRGMMAAAFRPSGECVGFVAVERGRRKKNQHTAFLDPLVVSRAHRRRGVGRALMLEAVSWARAQGIEKLWLGVFASNRRAIALYRSLGFEPDGRQRRQFKVKGRYVDGLDMALFLKR
ncbi:MAG TPA: GNAT family N-acetyltransferase [Gemmatimonadaceae bacterium]